MAMGLANPEHAGKDDDDARNCDELPGDFRRGAMEELLFAGADVLLAGELQVRKFFFDCNRSLGFG